MTVTMDDDTVCVSLILNKLFEPVSISENSLGEESDIKEQKMIYRPGYFNVTEGSMHSVNHLLEINAPS